MKTRKFIIVVVLTTKALLYSAIGMAPPVQGQVTPVTHEANSRRHVVTKGDTLGTIATMYGLSWEDVAQLNDLEPPYTIHVGQKLELPSLDYEIVIQYMKALSPKIEEEKAIALAHVYNVTAAKHELPVILLVAIAWQENRFRYSGIAGNDIGHMQLNFYWQIVKRGRIHKYSIEELDNNFRLNIELAGAYLNEIKFECKDQSLPWWTCYNAREPENQARYHDFIAGHMATIRSKVR